MENKTKNKIKLGAFVFAGIVIFTLLIYYIGQKQWLFTPTIRVSAYFNDVTGLQIGNKVRFTGYNVGSVDDIAIVSDTAARVEMIITKKATKFIKKDAIAIIGSEGLMGSKVINIGPGTKENRNIRDYDILKTQAPPSIDDILAQVEVTSQNASSITEDLADITSRIRNGQGVIGKLLVDSAYAEEIGKTISNVEKSTKGIKEIVPAVKHNFLLRGYYKKQQKEAEKKEEDRRKQEEDTQKDKENK
jgi:phospholipid/cholesterol/gamma-HCH transport system substrate-binding protein